MEGFGRRCNEVRKRGGRREEGGEWKVTCLSPPEEDIRDLQTLSTTTPTRRPPRVSAFHAAQGGLVQDHDKEYKCSVQLLPCGSEENVNCCLLEEGRDGGREKGNAK